MRDNFATLRNVKPKFPMRIKRGSVTVKIYRTPSKGYDRFTVAWHDGLTRRRLTFQDTKPEGNALARAKAEAEAIASKVTRGEAAALELKGRDRHIYVEAVERLKPTGAALDTAIAEFVEAHKALAGGSLIEAARFYAKRFPHKLPSKNVPEVFREFLKAKEADGLSRIYRDDLRYRCGAFARRFHRPIAHVTADEVRVFLDGLKLSARSHNNFLRSLRTMFEFAKSRGWLPKDHDELDGIGLKKDRSGAIAIYSPAELVKLFAAAPAVFVPALAIGAFAGLRSAEIERLEWSEVHLAEKFIEVTAGKSKTASRRLAQVPDNLAAWLAPHARRGGKVWPHGHCYFYDLQSEVAEKAGVRWKHNAMRHSFISYRLAQIQNVNQVALEAGNSPQMIFQHYRELVRPADAVKWFAIEPARPANVIAVAQMSKAMT
jgi:integrase